MLDAADKLRAQAHTLGYSEREIFDAGSRFDWNALARARVSMSLFARRRIIELRLPTGRPGKEGAAALVEFCAAVPADLMLLVTATTWSKQHEGAWSRKIDSSGAMVVFHAPRPHEWHAWIEARLAEQHVLVTSDAVALLASRVEGNLLAAAQEVEKLVLLRAGESVRLDAESMEKLIADSARYDIFKLTDAILAGQCARALHILAGLRDQGEELIGLMGWLINQLKLAIRLASARDFAAQAGIERLWLARQKLFARALRCHSPQHWRQCLARAAHIDRVLKGRALGQPWREVERLVVAMATVGLDEPGCSWS